MNDFETIVKKTIRAAGAQLYEDIIRDIEEERLSAIPSAIYHKVSVDWPSRRLVVDDGETLTEREQKIFDWYNNKRDALNRRFGTIAGPSGLVAGAVLRASSTTA